MANPEGVLGSGTLEAFLPASEPHHLLSMLGVLLQTMWPQVNIESPVKGKVGELCAFAATPVSHESQASSFLPTSFCIPEMQKVFERA